MAYYSRKRRATAWKSFKPKRSSFAASPAGKHRQLAMSCFKIAKRARNTGDTGKAFAALKIGRKALALSKSEYRMWKAGQTLSVQSRSLKQAMRMW